MNEDFLLVEGLPRNGKSLYVATLSERIILRNQKIFEDFGIKRMLVSNLKFSPFFEEKYAGWFSYWSEESQLYRFMDVDIIWDECQLILEARDYASISFKMLSFLAKYAKRGNRIIAITQDVGDIDKRARKRITCCVRVSKILGSPSPSPTRPPVKNPWGLIVVFEKTDFKTNPDDSRVSMFPYSFFFINSYNTSLFNTRDEPKDKDIVYKEHYKIVCSTCEALGKNVCGHTSKYMLK